MKDAPIGETRIEVVKAGWSVDRTKREYEKRGWVLIADAAVTKSFGTKARVTLTFRKER